MRRWKSIWMLPVLAALLAGLTGCSGKTFDLGDYAYVSYTGYDTQAEALVQFDHDRLADDLREAKLEGFVPYIYTAISYRVEPGDATLHNGATVILTFTVDEEATKPYKVRFKGLEQRYEVAGLPEMTELDLFAGLQLNFSGVSPYVSVNLVNSSDDAFLRGVTYRADKTANLREGETITVTAVYNEALAQQQGYWTGETERQYVVAGTDRYIQSWDELGTAEIAQMQAEALDLVESTIASGMDNFFYKVTGNIDFLFGRPDIYTVNDPVLTDMYFLTLKDGESRSWGANDNYVYLVYTVVAAIEGYDEPLEALVAVRYTDIIRRNDGSIDVVYSGKTIEHYDSRMDDMVRTIITTRKDRYVVSETEP